MEQPTQIDDVVVTAPRQTLRRPRGRVLLNGVVATQLIDAQITRTNYFVGDTFDASFALNGDPAHDFDWWAATAPIEVRVEFGMEGEDGEVIWTPLLKGTTDDKNIDWAGQRISVRGRDLTSRFVDNKVNKAFQNRSASDVITDLAQGRGLKADVTPTSRQSGTFYQKGHTSTHLETFKNAIEWDLMVHLAKEEGYELWVDSINETVHFHPWKEDENPYIVRVGLAETYDGGSIVGASNVTRLTIDQNINLAKDIRVVVKSYHSGLGKTFTATVGKAKPKDKDAEDVEEYAYSINNLTQAGCQAYAERYHDALTRHAYTVQFDAPAALSLEPRRGVRLDGMPTYGDQKYYIDDVQLRIDAGGGFTMSVRAKNIPETQAGSQ